MLGLSLAYETVDEVGACLYFSYGFVSDGCIKRIMASRSRRVMQIDAFREPTTNFSFIDGYFCTAKYMPCH